MDITGIVNIQCSHIFIKSTVDLQLGEKWEPDSVLKLHPQFGLFTGLQTQIMHYHTPFVIWSAQEWCFRTMTLSLSLIVTTSSHTTFLVAIVSMLSNDSERTFPRRWTLSITPTGSFRSFTSRTTKITAPISICLLTLRGHATSRVKPLRCLGSSSIS